MKNIIVVYLISEIRGGLGQNLAFEYEEGTALPKLGEYVYFGYPSLRFQITAREHLYQDDETVRIVYRLSHPEKVDESYEACLMANLIQLGELMDSFQSE